MYWADELLQNRTGKEWINDAWTPSGIVHMGGLKGPVIHDTLYRILKEKNTDVTWTFGFDNFDPVDGLPPELRESHGKYMGVPIFMVPSPDGNGTFADYFENKMLALFKQLNIQATIYKANEYYKNGVYDKAISYVLDHADEVRNVYGDIYKKQIAQDWFPLQVICPNCQKLGTTKVTAWDGQEVTFKCEPNLVKWAQGCGTEGKLSPFKGNAKMPFKVEWAAKWWTFGVTIEGAGKDHASAGGTYDVAMELCKRVFQKEPPLKIPYEFFLSGGKKMASSKGIGLTGEELIQIMPPEMVRFLMIKTRPNQAVEFSPYGTLIIPKLYDEYQKVADAYSQKSDDDASRIFTLSQIDGIQYPPKIRFTALAQWVQMPNMKQTIHEQGLDQWAEYTKVWIEKYAPESERFSISPELPENATKLSDNQKEYLQKVSAELNKQWEAEEFQIQLYNWAKELAIPSKDAFSAIYNVLIGKDHGPKAAWLILSLDKHFIQKRFANAVEANIPTAKISANTQSFNHPELFSINKQLAEKYPSISVGIAVIKNVHIEKTNPDLEKEKTEVLAGLQGLTTEQLGQYPEIISYRKLYRDTGIDWHSRRPSPEALLRRISLNKGLYTINTCVDAYNLIVMKQRVSVGAFDYDKIQFPTELRFAKESDSILLLGDQEPTQYKANEIAYFDQTGGYNIDFNYRDAQRTAVSESTKNILINVDGVYEITPTHVEKVLQETCDVIMKYCGGTLELFGIETI